MITFTAFDRGEAVRRSFEALVPFEGGPRQATPLLGLSSVISDRVSITDRGVGEASDWPPGFSAQPGAGW
jgi:hypothetical protein